VNGGPWKVVAAHRLTARGEELLPQAIYTKAVVPRTRHAPLCVTAASGSQGNLETNKLQPTSTLTGVVLSKARLANPCAKPAKHAARSDKLPIDKNNLVTKATTGQNMEHWYGIVTSGT